MTSSCSILLKRRSSTDTRTRRRTLGMKRRDGRGRTGEGRGPLISIFEGAGAVVGRAAVFIKACLRGTNAEGGREEAEGGRPYAHSLVLTHTTQGSIIEIGSRVCMHSHQQGGMCVRKFGGSVHGSSRETRPTGRNFASYGSAAPCRRRSPSACSFGPG